MRKNGVYKICPVCKKQFYIPKYREKKAVYCSRECQNGGQYEKHIKKCLGCGNKFKVSNSRIKRKFCSLECREIKHQNIKDRRKKLNLLAYSKRGNNSGRLTRKLAFSFKEKKCEKCGYYEYDFCLDVHHKDNNPLNNSLDNLIILCAHCHRKLHKKIICL